MIPTLDYEGPGTPPLWPWAMAPILLGLVVQYGAGLWYMSTYRSGWPIPRLLDAVRLDRRP